jgi:putative endonuclease
VSHGLGNLGVAVAEGKETWFCYMVRCSDRSLYVGIATDVPERVRKHNWGVGPEYTARRRPVELIWSEPQASAETARQREKEIEGWSKKKKLELVTGLRFVGATRDRQDLKGGPVVAKPG